MQQDRDFQSNASPGYIREDHPGKGYVKNIEFVQKKPYFVLIKAGF